MSTTRIHRDIAASPSVVYDALLNSSDVQQWMVPSGMTAIVHTFEPSVGGAIHMSLTYDDSATAGKTAGNTDTYLGRFEALEPGKKVVQSVEFESDDPSNLGRMLITMTLEEQAGGTRLLAVHENVPAGIDPELNELGWSQSLDKLAALVESR